MKNFTTIAELESYCMLLEDRILSLEEKNRELNDDLILRFKNHLNEHEFNKEDR